MSPERSGDGIGGTADPSARERSRDRTFRRAKSDLTRAVNLVDRATFDKAPWWALILEGVALSLLALLAAAAPAFTSLGLTIVVAWLYVVAGGVRIVSSLSHRGPAWGWLVAMGSLTLALGAFILLRPLIGLVSLSLALGAYFIANGLMSIAIGLAVGRTYRRKAWLTVAGLMDIFLAVLVLLGVLAGLFWILGLVVALNLLSSGANIAAIGLMRRTRKPLVAADPLWANDARAKLAGMEPGAQPF